MICNYCKASLDAQAKFCSHCGMPILDQASAIPSKEKAVKQSSPFWFKVLAAFMAVVIGGFLLNALLVEDLTDAVEGQLKAIRKGRLKEAYENYSSKGFQEATSFEVFKEFVQLHPAILNNQTIQFKERNASEDFGTLEGVITADGTDQIPIEFKLVKEGDRWKVLSIRLEEMKGNPSPRKEILQLTEANTRETRPLTSVQLTIGSRIDPSGKIIDTATLFQKESGDIYLNLLIKGADPKEEIKVLYEHLDSHSSLNPVKTLISETGDAFLSFAFSPPDAGWPKGSYRITAYSVSGAIGSINFQIE